MRISKKFAFKISEDNHDLLYAKALKAGISMTDFLNLCIENEPVIINSELKPLLNELKAVGKNLNQITTLCNMGKVSCPDLCEVKIALNQILETLNKGGEHNRYT
jgi:hypothetical protein